MALVTFQVQPDDLLNALDGLPEENVDCAELAVKTLQNAIFNWRPQVGHRRKGRVTTENRFENRVAARAGDLVSQGYHWAEAMLLTVGEHVMDDLEPRCVRMATGLAGGVGDTQQEMCGALSGGVLVIGGLLGRTSLSQSAQAALMHATRYRQRFMAEFGDTQCARLRETVVHVPGGLGSCAALVERAATILLELLMEDE